MDARPETAGRLRGRIESILDWARVLPRWRKLTAARTGKVIGPRWSEIDVGKKVRIVLPSERMKPGGKEHRGPLCATAIAILDERRPLAQCQRRFR